MRLIEILLEILKEGTGNYISPAFFVGFGKSYRGSSEFKDNLTKIEEISPTDPEYDEKRKDYEAELKEDMARAFVQIAVSKMFPDEDISSMTSKYVEDFNMVSVIVKDKVAAVVTISREGKKYAYTIQPEKTKIIYTSNEGEELYLWNPPQGKQQYKKSPILSPKIAKVKKIYGREEKPDSTKYKSTKQTVHNIFKGKSDKKAEILIDNSKNRMYVKEVEYAVSQAKEAEKTGDEPEIDIAGDLDSKVLKAYYKPRGGEQYSEERMSEICELFMKSIGNYCVSEGLVSDDSIEKEIILNKEGKPEQNKQKLKMSLGNIYVETVMNTKDYSIDRYNTKIVIQGIQVLPMEG